MNISDREKRDLFLLAGIVLLGVLLMFVAGQFAVRLLPNWNVPSEMGSKIDVNGELANISALGLAPLRPEILTPKAWQNTFLTPQAGDLDLLNEVPVVVIAPATAVPTRAPTSETQPTEAPGATATATRAATLTPFPTGTPIYGFPTSTFTARPPTNTPARTFTPTITSTRTSTFTPTITSTRTSTPTATFTRTSTFTPTFTATSTATFTSTFTATNSPSPTATATATFTPSSTFTASPTATATFTSLPTFTPTNTATPVTPIPPPGGVNIGNPDGSFVTFSGSVTFTISPAISTGSGYDFAFYERWLPDAGGGVGPGIQMDQVVVEVSRDNLNWCTVFYWGNASPDGNSNLAGFSPETDNFSIGQGSLYQNSGILIDIDGFGCISPGSYPYIRFTNPAGDVDGGADIDAVQSLH